MLYIDVETFSEVDLKKAGAHKYVAHPSFEVLIISYAFDDGPITTFCPCAGDAYPSDFVDAYFDPLVTLHAYNAVFERLVLAKELGHVPIARWYCGLVHAGSLGLPLSLADCAATLGLAEQKASAAGSRCINYFSKPIRPTKSNGMRTRNLPEHNPELWETYKAYNRQDVATERAIAKALQTYPLIESERRLYVADQLINDDGVRIDVPFAEKCAELCRSFSEKVKSTAELASGVANLGSVSQLKALCAAHGFEVESLNKVSVSDLLSDDRLPFQLRKALEARQLCGKSSVAKFAAALASVGSDGRACGLFQFNGAPRTGRWAGRRIQLQNLPQNHIEALDEARRTVLCASDADALAMYGRPLDVISQLSRTMLIPSEGCVFAVADYSAIEARVLAWLVGEDWRLDVFEGDGKIYEASAALMFHKEVSEIAKGSPERQKGKIAELALGYEGGIGAMERMGAAKIGLDPVEMQNIVSLWRAKSPRITQFWRDVETQMRVYATYGRTVYSSLGMWLKTRRDGDFAQILLPSGRAISYYRLRQQAESGTLIYQCGPSENADVYGGKFTENIVQSIARDCLAASLIQLRKAGFRVVGHVHDEVIVEVPAEQSDDKLRTICRIMETCIDWDDPQRAYPACGVAFPPKPRRLPLVAAGYVTPYYRKD